MGRILSLFAFCLLTFTGLTAQRAFKPVEIVRDLRLPEISAGKLEWKRAIKPPRIPLYETRTMRSSESFPENLPNPIPPGGLPIYYKYQALIRNNGKKKIQAISWQYIFYDLDSSKELDRHDFFSFQTIDKNKSAFIKGTSYAPPSKIVTLKSLEKNKRSPYLEDVKIRCVLYSDNSFWMRETVMRSECHMLRYSLTRHQRRRKLF